MPAAEEKHSTAAQHAQRIWLKPGTQGYSPVAVLSKSFSRAPANMLTVSSLTSGWLSLLPLSHRGIQPAAAFECHSGKLLCEPTGRWPPEDALKKRPRLPLLGAAQHLQKHAGSLLEAGQSPPS